MSFRDLSPQDSGVETAAQFPQKRGLLISIEGIDGSGKGTQAAAVVQRLRAAGHSCELISFPRYAATRFGREIGRFLNGEFGSLEQVDPTLVSLLFAGDRCESRDGLLQLLANHEVVICDRYVASNMAHQGAKVDRARQAELFDWIRFVEFDLFRLPKPDATFFLRIPIASSQELIAKKSQRSYTDLKADLQEADAAYLSRVAMVYDSLARTEPGWQIVECVDQNELRTPDAISDDLISRIGDLLESGEAMPGKSALDRVTSYQTESTSTLEILPVLPAQSSALSPEFLGLVSSRRNWLEESLRTWCHRACLADLSRAELEWSDLAGRVAPEKSLWKWAWERFQALVDPVLGLHELNEVEVTLTTGEVIRGFPDARQSQRGMLVLYGPTPIGYAHQPAISIDAIRNVQRVHAAEQ